MARTPSASYSLTMRIEIPSGPGAFATVAAAIADAEGDVGAIDLVRVTREHTVRDITVSAADSDHGQRIVDTVRKVPGVTIVNVSDRTFLMHLGGKIEVHNKVPVKTRDDLSMAYTPGVARVCLAIAEDVTRGASADDQAEHRRRRHRRHGRARPRRHRPGGRDAGDGGQGDAVQGVRRDRRLAARPEHQGHRRDHRHRQGDRPRLRRHQPGGHRRAALLRDRGPAATRARHPGLPRRPARHRRRRAGGAAERGQGGATSGWTS